MTMHPSITLSRIVALIVLVVAIVSLIWPAASVERLGIWLIAALAVALLLA